MAVIDANTVFGFWPLRRADLSVETLVAAMEAHGIERSLTYSAKALFFDPAEGNEDVATVCRQRPQLTPVAVLDPTRYPRTRDEAQRRLSQGFRLFRLFPTVHNYPLSVLPLERLLPTLAGASALMVDVSEPGQTSAAARLFCDFARPVLLAGVTSRLLGEALAAMEQCPALLLETSALHAAGALEAAVQTVGAERVVFGSSAALHSTGSAVYAVRYAALEESAKAAILGGNLTRVLSG
jgi:uncharacterized protein